MSIRLLERILTCYCFNDIAVLKYMAQDGCDRKEAQGNMDAFLENPQGEFTVLSYHICISLDCSIKQLLTIYTATKSDWGFQKVSEQNGAYKKDYANANMEPKQVILTTVWGVGVIYFLGSLIYNGVQDGIMVGSFHRTMELLGME